MCHSLIHSLPVNYFIYHILWTLISREQQLGRIGPSLTPYLCASNERCTLLAVAQPNLPINHCSAGLTTASSTNNVYKLKAHIKCPNFCLRAKAKYLKLVNGQSHAKTPSNAWPLEYCSSPPANAGPNLSTRRRTGSKDTFTPHSAMNSSTAR
jgi:hypothetical protein